MDMNRYQEISRRTALHYHGSREGKLNWALGLAGEVGEVANLVTKNTFYRQPTYATKELLIGELGDCLFYLASLADSYDIQLNEVAEYNVDKLAKRHKQGFDYSYYTERKINGEENK